MRFIVDTMLGTLAKWLRVLGYDASYAKGLDDDEIIALAKAQERVIISRDRELCSRVPGSILLDTKILDEQLIIVMRKSPPDAQALLTRCLDCNSVLENVAKSELPADIPEGVLARHEAFFACPGCGKVFWKGSHYQKMEEKARELVSQWLS